MIATKQLETCLHCHMPMEKGFCHRTNGLSFVAPAKLKKFLSVDEDLATAGISKFIPAKAEYYRSYVCRACSLYVVDYSTPLSSDQAKEAAAELERKAS